MKSTQHIDYKEIARKRVIQADPLSDIAIVSLNKILQNSKLSREEKLRLIVEHNFSFSIIYHCLLTNKNIGELHEMDFAFILLQIINWYKINSVDRSIYWAN
jgi:hypothetical protein